VTARARRADRQGARSLEFVFPHRNSPPSGQRVGDSQPPNSIHARLPLRHQANFAAFVPRERPQLAFFTPCCKKITQRNINFLSGELPFCRWLDATVLRICDRFYWLKRAFTCPRPRFDCRGPAGTGSASQYRFAIVRSCALAWAKRPSLGGFDLSRPGEACAASKAE